MTRSVWTGSLSFGLVNVPVKAYTAVRDHTVHFHQLERETGARIRHENVSEESGDEVDRDDMLLGYEIRKGRYVTFERGELDELKPESTKAVEISDFVALADVDPIYYQRTYWLGPDGDPAKQAYQLLLAAMEDRERVAIGSVVMRNKQYLAAIRPLDGVLALSTMRFADEVVPKADIDELPTRRPKIEAKAKKLAYKIVDSLTADWDPSNYHDTFTEQLHEIIERKDEGKEVVAREETRSSGEVLDLMAALQASVDATKGSRSRRGTAKALAAAAEDLAAELDQDEDEATSTKKPAKRSAAKKKPAAKKATAEKKPAAKKAAAKKKPAAKKAAAKKKPAAKKAAARKRATKKAA